MIYRIDVKTAPAARGGQGAVDSLGESIRHQIAEFGRTVGPIRTARIFLIDALAEPAAIHRAAGELLADPIVERAEVVSGTINDAPNSRIEIHLKPGVMDPVAASTEMALKDMGIDVREVRTGRAYVIEGKVPREELEYIAGRILANPVVESLHFDAFVPKELPRAHVYEFKRRHVPIRDLGDDQLVKLSRDGHLFLSLEEMKAIQAHYRSLEREPTDVELETLAQTWSEHCVHKTLKSAVDLEVRDEAGKVLEKRHYENLIRDTIFKSTMELIEGGRKDFCLSVFSDNAGVIAFDETDAVCFKVETHNRPSAIDPYGGSATGVGGVIRDVLGTGLAARPIANTDVFCVADPNFGRPDALLQIANQKSKIENLPKGILHPKRILQQVVAGVRDYGNRMGIPTLNGAVYFDNRYVGNPLVFCGCVGLLPRNKIQKAAKPGDAIVVMGGRTGRDGIHGATFSSAELTTSHADEFSHAVQIGNAITEKKMTDVVLQARDLNLFNAITDCGAGGLSSAVGEMGERTGAAVHLDKVPLKYAGLKYDEIWISEAQERMVLAVPPAHVNAILKLAKDEDVEATVIGYFGADDHFERGAKPMLYLYYKGHQVGDLSMDFVHKGVPMPRRKAVCIQRGTGVSPVQIQHGRDARATLKDKLFATLSHPNIASKHWIIRQYDHEVQGGSVIKPLIGPEQRGPSDAAVLRPKLSSNKGVVISCGLSPHIEDPYDMAIASIDEAVRNAVAVGADPAKLAILDNFCWPGTNDELSMGSLVRTCEACYDAAKAYGIPFISGKDSLHNQFTNQETKEVIRIPNTLLISAIGVIDDVRKCVTMDLKGNMTELFLVGAGHAPPSAPATRATHASPLHSYVTVHRALSSAIRKGWVRACHDVSDGGLLTAAAEMCIASNIGVGVEMSDVDSLFSERIASYLIEVENRHMQQVQELLRSQDIAMENLGPTWKHCKLTVKVAGKLVADIEIDALTKAWRGTLDW